MAETTRRPRNDEGVILLLALFVIALFTIMVLEFSYSTMVEHRIASGARDDLLALSIARSGVFETIALLREDRMKEIEDKKKEDEDKGRAEGETASGTPLPTPTPLGGKAKKQQPWVPEDITYPDHYGEEWARERYREPFGPGYLTLKVVDESGKINVNLLVKEQKEITAAARATPTPQPGAEATPSGTPEEEKKPPPRAWGQKDIDRTGETAAEPLPEGEVPPVRYVVDNNIQKDIMRLLKILDVKGVDPEKVTAAIVDWMDSNDEGDWEETAYEAGGEVSPPKNAPLEVLSELLMVQGVTGDLFFGPGRPEEINLDEEMKRRGQRKREGRGLRDCLTVCSRSKINVNTAPAEVLAALLEEENEALVKEIESHTRKGYFKDLAEFQESIGEHIPATFKSFLCVGSDSFQIISEGRVNESRKQVRAYVFRDDEAVMKILEWRVE